MLVVVLQKGDEKKCVLISQLIKKLIHQLGRRERLNENPSSEGGIINISEGGVFFLFFSCHIWKSRCQYWLSLVVVEM